MHLPSGPPRAAATTGSCRHLEHAALRTDPAHADTHARPLGLQVLAEGVEEPEQLAGLRAMGMPLVQGYLLCRPQPAAQITALLGQRLVEPAPSLV